MENHDRQWWVMCASGSTAVWSFVLMLAVLFASAGERAHAAKPCAPQSLAYGWTAPRVSTPKGDITFDVFIEQLAQYQVILLGEQHDRLDHHLNQLEIICRLGRYQRPVALGFEQFQYSRQQALDKFRRGDSSHTELLKETEYFSRWGFDYRVYQPILDFAVSNTVAMVALNAPRELVSEVRERGLENMSDEPEVAHVMAPDEAYVQRLTKVFSLLQGSHGADLSLDRLIDVQLLWDETMAERAARHAVAFREQRLIVLAGNGHVVPADAIGARIRKRAIAGVVRVAQADATTETSLAPDDTVPFTLRSKALVLPEPGRLGVELDRMTGPGLGIRAVGADSAAARAGIQPGERLVSVAGTPVSDMASLRLMLWDRKPGDSVTVGIGAEDGKQRELLIQLR